MLVFLLSLNVTAFSHTDIIRQAWPSISREEECGRLCPPGTGRVRVTQMEGSFGTQKEHYAMRRIKARKKKTEILYIFFGIHTANAVHMAERLAELQETKAA